MSTPIWAAEQHTSKGADKVVDHVTLYILSTRQELHIPLQAKIILGRSSQTDEEGTLYVDLAPYYGYKLGVSRRHLMLVYDEHQGLMAFDLASDNGSFLNGQRMSSNTGYMLKDGTELMLGSLGLRVYIRENVPFADMQRKLYTPLPKPVPDIRETLETRPLKSYSEDDEENT